MAVIDQWHCPKQMMGMVCGCRYAMREALAITAEEGLKEQWQRHEAMHHMLWDGLKSMGLKSFVENDSERLITVNTIKVTSPPLQWTLTPLRRLSRHPLSRATARHASFMSGGCHTGSAVSTRPRTCASKECLHFI